MSFKIGATAGLDLCNTGLGPAAVTNTSLSFDGKRLGEFDESNVNTVRAARSVRPSAVTLGGQPLSEYKHNRFLLSIESYDPDQNHEFHELIRHRLRG